MPSAIVLFLLSPFSLSTPRTPPDAFPSASSPFFFFLPLPPLIPGPKIPTAVYIFFLFFPNVYAATLSGAAQPVHKHDFKKKKKKASQLKLQKFPNP